MTQMVSFWAEFAPKIRQLRARFGYFKMLMDCSEYATQETEVQQYSESRSSAMVEGGRDRVAIIVASSLLKAQARRVIQSERLGLFVSADAAKIWLGAHG